MEILYVTDCLNGFSVSLSLLLFERFNMYHIFNPYVCGSGLQDPIASSLLSGGVPYPEHRLNWSLDSVPIFRFLCFLSVIFWSLPFHPSKIQPGSLLYKTSCPSPSPPHPHPSHVPPAAHDGGGVANVHMGRWIRKPGEEIGQPEAGGLVAFRRTDDG